MTALNYVRHLAGGGVGAVYVRRSLTLRFRSTHARQSLRALLSDGGACSG